ncbi:MAG: M16 family metallopeptidase, partial [Planctomycetia bacterium]
MAADWREFDLENGLKLLVEPIAGVQSAAFTLLIPAGVSHERPDRWAVAHLLTGLTSRGAGDRDSRELQTALDRLGVGRGESAEVFHSSYYGSVLGRNLEPALELTADVVRRPHLDPEQFEFCRSLVEQEIQSLEDEPGSKLFLELKKLALPEPLGKSHLGTEESLADLSVDEVVDFHRHHYQPDGAILGVAGAVDPDAVYATVRRLFDDWEPKRHPRRTIGARVPARSHLPADKQQTQMGVAFDAVASGDPDV